MKQRPSGITALAVWSGLGALLGAVLGIASLAASFGMFDADVSLGTVAVAMAVVFGLSAALSAAQAWGLWKLRSWARTLTIVLGVIGLLAFPVGTIVYGIILWYLFQPHVKTAFGAGADHGTGDVVIDPGNGGSWPPSDPDYPYDQGSSGVIAHRPKASAWLVNDDGGASFQLNQGDTRLGRGTANDIILADPAISREQALIREQNASYTLYDRASTYGTFVNGQRVAGPVLLRHGDVIRMGDLSLRLVSQE
jgi:hypothetical protein